MKKLVSLTLALLIALLALLPAVAEETRTIRTGVLSMLNVTEAEMVNYKRARALIGRQLEQEGAVDNALRQFLDDDAPEVNCEIVYFDTLDAMLMALNAEDIDEMDVYETTAQYLTHSDPGLVQFMTFNEGAEDKGFVHLALRCHFANDFAFLFMEDNTALRDEFDAALQSITDAEMEKLVQDHITAAINGEEISPIQMPVIEGAETIKVAVTGSLPPMDYVAPDGTPAGFNTALLAEISQRIGKNIELVVVDSVGRAAALASGNVDAVFWTRTNSASNRLATSSEEERASREKVNNQEMSEEEKETVAKLRELIDLPEYGRADMPEGTIITEPYFSDFIVPVTTQARLDKGDARANR